MELTKPQDLVRQLMNEVHAELEQTAHPGIAANNMEALIAHRTIQRSEEMRETFSRQLRAVQALVTVRVARGQMWLDLITPESPNGFGSLREFLDSAGLGRQAVSVLNTLGSFILPYCDEHGIDVEQYLSETTYPVFVEAIPALRRRIELIELESGEWVNRDEAAGEKRTGNRCLAGPEALDDVTEILNDVERTDDRQIIRDKYQRKNTDPSAAIGVGGWVRVGHKAVLVVVLEDPDDVPKVNAGLNNKIMWELVAAGRATEGSIRIDVEG